MTNTSNQELVERIERLVQEHIRAIHASARAAIDQAFTAATPRTPAKCAQRAPAPRERTRRATADVAALSERLFEAVTRRPGESMVTLARELGSSTRELHLPMSLLRQAGRVRCAGERQLTRYFPMASSS